VNVAAAAVVFADHATTGDGTLTGIVLLDAVARRRRPLSELAGVVTRLPQVLRNVPVGSGAVLEEPAATGFWREVDAVAGEPVAQLASLLKIDGQIISYTARARQPLSIPVVHLIFRGLSVHGYWLNLWLQRTPQDIVAQTYHELASLVADGTLSAPVAATYALADYREAIAHAARNDRNGKVLFDLR